jgi:hypothetical protein
LFSVFVFCCDMVLIILRLVEYDHHVNQVKSKKLSVCCCSGNSLESIAKEPLIKW